jgi:hypothetical protein
MTRIREQKAAIPWSRELSAEGSTPSVGRGYVLTLLSTVGPVYCELLVALLPPFFFFFVCCCCSPLTPGAAAARFTFT